MTDHDPEEETGPDPGPETLAAQALGRIDETTRAIVPPLHPSTTYLRDPDGGYRSGRGYTRPHNPTYDHPEALLTALERGESSLLFASGMAAATAVFQALLPGDHVIAPRVMYWALRKWLGEFAVSWGLDVEFVDTADLRAVARAVRPGRTRLLWLETPANPTWEVTDIAAAAALVRDAGIRVAVDSTVATPVLTRPLELGADLVVHSASKYLNGHSDVLAGAVVTRRRDGPWQRIRAWHRDGGAVLGPFEAWLLLRGMRTLFVRVRHSSATALAIARHFAGHPGVTRVLYPGLPSDPGHEVAARQMQGGFGGMLSLRVAGGEAAAVAVAARVRVFKRATSLGGVESLIEHRASIEGPGSPVPGDLLRLSIGLESPADLLADLEQAIGGASAAAGIGSPASGDQVSGPGDAPSGLPDLVATRVRPLVVDRGGDVEHGGFANGVLTLRVTGSPGAVWPMRDAIVALARQYAPEVADVRLVTSAGAGPDDAGGDDLAAAVRRVLAEQVNPAVAAHGGAVALVKVVDGTAHLRLDGRCQGCTLAEVTLRQGVAVILREAVPAIREVVDVTDHAAGTDPYFAAGKGAST